MPVGRLDSYPVPVSAIHANYANRRFLINLIVLGKPRSDETRKGNSSKGIMDKAAALQEILAQDPKNSFARYGLAMELAGRGETEAALSEFTSLLENDGNYTAGYFMAAQTLANAGRTPEAIERLQATPTRPAKCKRCWTNWTARRPIQHPKK
jgi:predicted Zn-dependent protease